ncbi:hyaluronidase isoform X2 [Hyalella azteca]|nr:hyaluronidase isoform X2 [Hyalella azteca]
MVIIYEPGSFPHYTPDGQPINGGIPQRGNISLHSLSFKQQLSNFVQSNFSGLLVLDFEDYFPRYNEFLPKVYRKQSLQWVRETHPNWTDEQVIEREAARSFDETAKPFFQLLLDEAAASFPGARVGYYHYPYCNAYTPPYLTCDKTVQNMNDEIRPWLLDRSSAFYPSLYLHLEYPIYRRWNAQMAKLREALRMKNADVPVLPYIRYRFTDVNLFLERLSLQRLLWLMKIYGAQGTVVWGAAYDLESEKSCRELQDNVNNVLGPTLKCFHDMNDSDVRRLKNKFNTLMYQRFQNDRSQLLHKHETQSGGNAQPGEKLLQNNPDKSFTTKDYDQVFIMNDMIADELNPDDCENLIDGNDFSSNFDLSTLKKEYCSYLYSEENEIRVYSIISGILDHYCGVDKV